MHRWCLPSAVFVIIANAGCLAGPYPPKAGGAADDAEPFANGEATTRTALVSLSGKTGTGACVAAFGRVDCTYPDPGQNTYASLAYEGDPLRLVGNLTWTASSGLTGRLNAFLLVDEGSGLSFKQGYPVAFGQSPLAVDFDLSNYKGAMLGLAVSSTQRTTDGDAVYLIHAAPQTFAFAGTLIYRR